MYICPLKPCRKRLQILTIDKSLIHLSKSRDVFNSHSCVSISSPLSVTSFYCVTLYMGSIVCGLNQHSNDWQVTRTYFIFICCWKLSFLRLNNKRDIGGTWFIVPPRFAMANKASSSSARVKDIINIEKT